MTRGARWWGVAVVAVAVATARGADAPPSPVTPAETSTEPPPAPEAPNPLAERLGLTPLTPTIQLRPPLTPTIALRGRIEPEAILAAQSQASQAVVGTLQNGYGFRRARLGAEGEIGTSARWVAEFEFATGNIQFRDVYVGLTALPGVNEVRVGYVREPFSLEGATSARFITFLERSPQNVLDPTRNWGFAGYWYPDSERMTFAIGGFRDGTNSFGLSSGNGDNWAVTSRLTGLPVYEPEGVFRLVHVGAAVSYRNPLNGVVQYNIKPQANLLTVSDNPGTPLLPQISIPAISQQLYNVQAAAVYGPFSAQAEWSGTTIPQPGGAGTVFLYGFYAYTSYFLTGEHRGYDKPRGAFGQVDVLRPLVRTRDQAASGCGAVEVAARFSVTNFETSDIVPGSQPPVAAPTATILYQGTFGVNWYLNSYTRVMFNYTLSVPQIAGYPALPVHTFGVRTSLYW